MIYFQGLDNILEYFRNARKYQNLRVEVPLDLDVPEKFLSVCTTCMNRLEDLKRTLPQNLLDSESYENVEFVLLDYSSTDGLEDWVRSSLKNYLDSGRLRFCRYEGSKYFRPNHSRNVSFRLTKGDIVINVDSDNIIHKGFLERINQCASVADGKLLIIADDFLRAGSTRLNLKGRFALYKQDIEFLRGFDEELDDGFGYDDLNFVLRAMLSHFKMPMFEKEFNYDRIETSDEGRIQLTERKDFEDKKAENKRITDLKIYKGILTVNKESEWGKHDIRD